MTNNNDYLHRWRDAISDPPPFLWKGQVMDMAGGTHYMIRRTADFIDHLGGAEAPDAIRSWLDITTVPGVAREAVQAAVDAIHEKAHYWMSECQHEAPFHEVGDRYGGIAAGLKTAMDIIETETGVTPSEVQP